MAKVHPHITEDLAEFIRAQHVFFVASAPLGAEGHVNLSPKGHDCLRILSDSRVAYLDLTGSGNETSAHLAENGRITLMFCAFAGPPRILRLYGQGRVVLPSSPEWPELFAQFSDLAGARQIVVAEISRVQTSCGFAVPFMEYTGEREALLRWADSKGPEALVEYRREKNGLTIDGMETPIGRELKAVNPA
jgi:hypothetical protein